MLVLHPSSRCDVCLDSYAWDSPTQSPHAIPCGHIFCKTCLLAVTPTNCPLCRKPFTPDRAKKLHIDRPENVELEKDVDLLQRLSLAWGENTPEEDLAALAEEVEAYLQDRPSDSSLPLRKARDGLARYQVLKEKRERDRKTISQLNSKLRTTVERAEHDQTMSKAVEDSLLSKVEDLTNKHSELESELEKLRAELAKYKHTTNPLPPPPQPLPLDRFPAFARATAAGISSAINPDSSANPDSTHDEDFIAAPFVSPDPAVRAEILAKERQAAEDREAAETRKRENIAKRKQKQPLYNIYRYPANTDSTSKQRNGIIPGATPNQRVVPERILGENHGLSSAEIASTLGPNSVPDPVAPVTAYVAGYADAYGYGYHYAPAVNGVSSHDGVINLSSVGHALPSDRRTERRHTYDNFAISTAPYDGGLGSYGVPGPVMSQDRDESIDNSDLLQHPRSSSLSTSVNGHGSRSHTSHGSRSSRFRRDSQTDGSATDSTLPASSTPHVPRPRRRSTHRASQDSTEQARTAADADRASVSSWGTLPTQGSHHSGSGISDLGLGWFPPGTGVSARSSMSSDSSVNPYYPFQPQQHGTNPSSSNSVVDDETPRVSHRAHPPAADPLQTLSMLLETNPGSSHTRTLVQDRPRHLRFSSVTEVASFPSSNEENTSHSHRSDSHRRRHRRMSSSSAPQPPVVPPPPVIPVDEGYLSDAPAHLNGSSLGNALGLDLTEEPIPTALQISAPTPIVSSRSFLRSWSYDPQL